jgi:D-alanyl-D-alanine-carboxypeptidase/D-alanyl-D-alanine-endopeptidase
VTHTTVRFLAVWLASLAAILAQPGRGATVEAKPVEVKPVEAKPVEAKPVEAKPVEAKPGIERLAAPLVKGKAGVGIVVGTIAKDGRKVFRFGEVPVPGGKVHDGDILFEIGSITKVFTTLLLADMVERKSVKLEDPVRLFLPPGAAIPKRGGKEITLLHLATHTSGLPRVPPGLFLTLLFHPGDLVENPYAHYSARDLYSSLAYCKLTREPGEREEYSNVGMGLLGNALVYRSGAKSYDDLVVERVCGPLGMKDTRGHLSADREARFAAGHDAGGDPTAHWTLITLEGCGILRSTANDMLTFLDANLLAKKTKLRKAMEACHKTYPVPGSKNLRLALGWQIENLPKGGKPMLWHNGGTGGFRSFAGLVPQTQTAVVVLSNSAQLDDAIDELGVHVLELLDARNR